MLITLNIKYTSGLEEKCVAALPDFIAFEQEFDRSIAKFEQEMRLTDFAWLGWHTQVRAKKTVAPFDEWINDIESLWPVADGDEIVPLESPPPIG